MSWLSRVTNVFRRDRLDRELQEELAAHLEEAAEHGRSSHEARRAFGSLLQHRERSRDLKLLPWLDSLLADAVFAWRQMRKRPAATASAVLSLALAIGSTTAVYRISDALLLRPLPIAHPEQFLYVTTTYVDRDGKPDYLDEFDYPTFRRYRDAASGIADVMVVGIRYLGEEPERARRQFVSGNVFSTFGLQPALGRLLTPDDDRTPGGHPVAVISYHYWTGRFAADPAIVGKTIRVRELPYTIVGVAPRGFTGTEPGFMTDLFLPAMMNTEALDAPGWSWFRMWVRPKPGVSPEQVRQVLDAEFAHDRDGRLKELHSDTPRQVVQNIRSERVTLLPAATGASGLQKQYRQPLAILAGLVVLVLLVACANVGNLLAAQASARSRELALRVSIGAGRMRLVQLVLVESTALAILGSIVGMAFASWSAPWIVSMLRVPQDPVQFVWYAGWRTWSFNVALALGVTLLFGLAPALRASSVQPSAALKGGVDPHGRRRLMNALLAAQMAFCILVQFIAGLFVTTFHRLSNRPLGFSPDRVLILSSSAQGKRSPEEWRQVADHLRATPGVESVSLAGWPLLSGNRWTRSIRVSGHAVEARPSYILDVSPGFFATMRIAMLNGRDFRPGDTQPRAADKHQALPGVGIVNEAFVRTYFDGRNPVGHSVDMLVEKDVRAATEIIGVVRDTPYGNLREDIRPTLFVPQQMRNSNSILVRTAGPPRALAPLLRAKVPEARSDYWVRTIEYESEYVRWHAIRERVLAALALFFAMVALVLAAVGLYGVLNYSVTQQRREIGIRMALGARAMHVVRRVTAHSVAIVTAGLAVGLVGGIAAARIVESLLYEVKPTDADVIALPALALVAAAILAAAPPAIRAVRIDPARTLRSE
jgi:predicted permease